MTRRRLSGVILSGGRGARAGGRDKGLLRHAGRPLAAAAAAQLWPHVSAVWVSANRHRSRYAALGLHTVPDAWPGFRGPLAGLASALARVDTPFAVIVPCDGPYLPRDFVARLWTAMRTRRADVCVACSDDGLYPLHVLLKTRLHRSMAAALAAGQGGVQAWLGGQHWTAVRFPRGALVNLNTGRQLAHARTPLRARGGDHAGASSARKASP